MFFRWLLQPVKKRKFSLYFLVYVLFAYGCIFLLCLVESLSSLNIIRVISFFLTNRMIGIAFIFLFHSASPTHSL
ncbi:hypothetical protein BX070DRAFT_227882 [Coemansia spiralis]|nr:hypothetical protein BX070DRAFT_227882 [Coemansia spiralis]